MWRTQSRCCNVFCSSSLHNRTCHHTGQTWHVFTASFAWHHVTRKLLEMTKTQFFDNACSINFARHRTSSAAFCASYSMFSKVRANSSCLYHGIFGNTFLNMFEVCDIPSQLCGLCVNYSQHFCMPILILGNQISSHCEPLKPYWRMTTTIQRTCPGSLQQNGLNWLSIHYNFLSNHDYPSRLYVQPSL